MAAKPPSRAAEKRAVGRPTVWTGELETAFFKALGTGCSISDAAISCGLGKDTVMRRQRADSTFRECVERSRCDFKVGSLAIIARAATNSWQAAAWYLERVYPAEFGRHDRVRVDGNHEPAVVLAVAQLAAIHERVATEPHLAAALDAELERRASEDEGATRSVGSR